MKVSIDDVKVGKRIRSDIGDLTDLIESIKKFGLINPIAINERNVLLAGYRRLEACPGHHSPRAGRFLAFWGSWTCNWKKSRESTQRITNQRSCSNVRHA